MEGNSMRKLFLLVAIVGFFSLAQSVAAFGWFNILDASITHLQDQDYRLRVTISYGGNWLGSATEADLEAGHYVHDYGPDPGGFGPELSAFSLNALGTNQSNSYPYEGLGAHGNSSVTSWTSATGNHGFRNVGLPNTFGYDFNLTDGSRNYFDLAYNADLSWFWGVGSYGEGKDGTYRAYVVPELPTLTLLITSLLGLFGTARLSRRLLQTEQLD
jgi:hypothetical protein